MVSANAVKQRDIPMDGTFHYTLSPVELGTDEDGDKVTSCVVRSTEPVQRKPVLGAQQLIAMQALDDAVEEKGEVKYDSRFPQNRRFVPVNVWREYSDVHSLSEGKGESAQREAFHTAEEALYKKEAHQDRR